MTGSEVRSLRLFLKETQTQFAHRLGYSHYQRIVELESDGKHKIPRQAEWRINTACSRELVRYKRRFKQYGIPFDGGGSAPTLKVELIRRAADQFIDKEKK